MKHTTSYYKCAFGLSIFAATGFSTLAQAQDLIYVPLKTPCEVISTLKTATPFSTGENGGTETRAYRAWSNAANPLTDQGGGECQNPDASRIPLAISVTLTARSRGGFGTKGNLTAYALGADAPASTESHLNFWNQNITNTTTIPLAGGVDGKHFNLRARIFDPVIDGGKRKVNVTASVLGYYYAQTTQAAHSGARNVLTVSASNADFTTPEAALASIGDASVTNPYQINIGPGIYSLAKPLMMKPYVCIQGAGQKATTLEWSGALGAALNGANHSTLSDMTVKRNGGGNFAVAIKNKSVGKSFYMRDLKVMATGDSGATAIENVDAQPKIEHVMASATGNTAISANIGIDNSGRSNPMIVDSHIMASGGRLAHGNVAIEMDGLANATIQGSTLIAEDVISLTGSNGTTSIKFSTLNGHIDEGAGAKLNCTYNVGPNNVKLNSSCSAPVSPSLVPEIDIPEIVVPEIVVPEIVVPEVVVPGVVVPGLNL